MELTPIEIHNTNQFYTDFENELLGQNNDDAEDMLDYIKLDAEAYIGETLELRSPSGITSDRSLKYFRFHVDRAEDSNVIVMTYVGFKNYY